MISRLRIPGIFVKRKREINLSTDQNSEADSKNEPARALRGKGGFYHNGRFVSMREVIEDYHSFLDPSLTGQQTIELVAYLKSL
jgi:hypothetical protein